MPCVCSILEGAHHETRFDHHSTDFVRIDRNGRQRLHVQRRNGTWSLVQYLPDGNSCVLETGEDWNGGKDAGEVLAMLTD